MRIITFFCARIIDETSILLPCAFICRFSPVGMPQLQGSVPIHLQHPTSLTSTASSLTAIHQHTRSCGGRCNPRSKPPVAILWSPLWVAVATSLVLEQLSCCKVLPSTTSTAPFSLADRPLSILRPSQRTTPGRAQRSMFYGGRFLAFTIRGRGLAAGRTAAGSRETTRFS